LLADASVPASIASPTKELLEKGNIELKIIELHSVTMTQKIFEKKTKGTTNLKKSRVQCPCIV
jgi:hypothetical protein